MDENTNEELNYLRREVERLKTKEERQELSRAASFLGLVSTYFVVGPQVAKACEVLIEKYKSDLFAVHDQEIASLFAAVIRRLSLVLLLGIICALLPTILLIYQNRLIANQNMIMLDTIKMEREFDSESQRRNLPLIAFEKNSYRKTMKLVPRGDESVFVCSEKFAVKNHGASAATNLKIDVIVEGIRFSNSNNEFVALEPSAVSEIEMEFNCPSPRNLQESPSGLDGHLDIEFDFNGDRKKYRQDFLIVAREINDKDWTFDFQIETELLKPISYSGGGGVTRGAGAGSGY